MTLTSGVHNSRHATKVTCNPALICFDFFPFIFQGLSRTHSMSCGPLFVNLAIYKWTKATSMHFIHKSKSSSKYMDGTAWRMKLKFCLSLWMVRPFPSRLHPTYIRYVGVMWFIFHLPLI